MTFPAPLTVPLSNDQLNQAVWLIAQPELLDIPTCVDWIAALLDHIEYERAETVMQPDAGHVVIQR